MFRKPEAFKKLGEKLDNNISQQLQNNILKAFYEQPTIKRLAQPDKKPSYISSRDFGNALFDLFIKAGAGNQATTSDAYFKGIKDGIGKLKNESTKNILNNIVLYAECSEGKFEAKIASVRKSIEEWYDGTMERANGWYKRQAQIVALVIGLILAISFNVDSIGLAKALWQDQTMRNIVVATAVNYVDNSVLPGTSTDGSTATGSDKNDASSVVQDTLKNLGLSGLPIGWYQANSPPARWDSLTDWLLKIFGWVLTAFAVSQGSPIWFDFLGRFINMRGTGKKPSPNGQST